MRIAVEPGGRFVAADVSLLLLIAAAYRVGDYQILGAKGWMSGDRWFIEAMTAGGAADPPSAAPPFLNVPDRMAARLRSLLEDRFQLKTHRENREMQVYVLTVGRNGAKLPSVEPPPAQSAPPPAMRAPLRPNGAIPESFAPPPGSTVAGPGVIVASAISMSQITLLLQRLMDLPVVDRTGLTGYFNVRLQFDPETAPRTAASASQPAPLTAGDPAAPPLLTAIQDQLGLKLERRKEPVEVLAIDSAQKPVQN